MYHPIIFHPIICPFVHLPVCSSIIHPLIHLFIHLPMFPSTIHHPPPIHPYIHVCFTIHPSIIHPSDMYHPAIYPAIHLSAHPSCLHLPDCLHYFYLCPSVYSLTCHPLTTCPSVHLTLSPSLNHLLSLVCTCQPSRAY